MSEGVKRPEGSPQYHRAQLISIRNKLWHDERLLPAEIRYLHDVSGSSKSIAGPTEATTQRTPKTMRYFAQDFAYEAAVLRSIQTRINSGAELSSEEKSYLSTGKYPEVSNNTKSNVGEIIRAKKYRRSAAGTATPGGSEVQMPSPVVRDAADDREEISLLVQVDYDIPMQTLIHRCSLPLAIRRLPPVYQSELRDESVKKEGLRVRRFVAIPVSGGELKDLEELMQQRNLEPATLRELLTFYTEADVMPLNFTMHAFGSVMPGLDSDDVWTPVLERHDFTLNGGKVETDALMYDIGSKKLPNEKNYVLAVRRSE